MKNFILIVISLFFSCSATTVLAVSLVDGNSSNSQKDSPKYYEVINIEPYSDPFESIICPDLIRKEDIETYYDSITNAYYLRWTPEQIRFFMEEIVDAQSTFEDISDFYEFLKSLETKEIISISNTGSDLGLIIKVKSKY